MNTRKITSGRFQFYYFKRNGGSGTGLLSSSDFTNGMSSSFFDRVVNFNDFHSHPHVVYR